MTKVLVYDHSTGTYDFQENQEYDLPVEELTKAKLGEVANLYNAHLYNGFVSSASGSPIRYHYDDKFQLIYSKWANYLSLDSNASSVSFETNEGFITLTRDQFLQLMSDIQSFEMDLINKRIQLESQINNSTSQDELHSINISF